jgi:uncharacterized membrane protein YbhN (UPF0104 family)
MTDGSKPQRSPGRKRAITAIQVVVSLAIVAAVFLYALPKIADYSKVGAAISKLSVSQFLILLGITFFNIFTYWPQMLASMPGLTIPQAAVNNQTSTTVANTVPAGGIVAIGLTSAIFRSWGFTYSAITLSELLTFVWNTFAKLGLPIIALAILAVQGKASPVLVTAALIGLVVLVAAIVLFGLVLWKKELARRIGARTGAMASSVRKLFRKPPVSNGGEVAVRFRHRSIEVIARRWLALTISTIVSHLGLYLVLLVSLRYVGVSEKAVSWADVLGVFAFVRLLSALPLTPGGLGIVELGYIGGLYILGRHHADVSPVAFKAQVAAGVLLFRALTYGMQIPLGGITYVIWKLKKSWLKSPPPEPAEPVVVAGVVVPG